MSRHPRRGDKGYGAKVRYITQVKARPPTFVVFVSGAGKIDDTELRFFASSLHMCNRKLTQDLALVIWMQHHVWIEYSSAQDKIKEISCFAASYISQIHTQFSRPSGGGFRKLALVSLARLSVTKFAKHFLIAFYLHEFFPLFLLDPLIWIVQSGYMKSSYIELHFGAWMCIIIHLVLVKFSSICLT